MARFRLIVGALPVFISLSLASFLAYSQSTPLYSWWDSHRQDNRATTSPDQWMSEEKIQWRGNHIANGPVDGSSRLYRLEGLIFHPHAKQPQGTVALISWYNEARGDYLSTTHPHWGLTPKQLVALEKGSYRVFGFPEREGYQLQRLEGYLYSPTAPQPEDTVPVFSWWHPERKDNFLTSNPQWSMPVEDIIWNGESIANGPTKEGYRLYRLEGYAKKPLNRRWPALTMKAQVVVRHTNDASRAANDIEAQVLGLGDGFHLKDLRDSGKRFRMHGVDSGGVKPHYQGVGFLRDVRLNSSGVSERHRRSVLSYNYGEGLIISSAKIARGITDGVTQWENDKLLRFQDTHVYYDIMNEPRMGNHAHPGGLQTHGDMIAIAMEQPKDSKRAAVYFIQVDGMTPRFVTSLPLGTGGAPGGLDIDSAAASGFIKLKDGFLAAVSGADHGKQGIWFYKTASRFISPEAEWRFVDFWTPDRLAGGICNINDGKVSLNCYVGAGGGVSLIANSDEGVYLVATTGTHGRGKDDEYAQIFRLQVEETPSRTLIQMQPKWFGKKKLGRLAMKAYSMRWAGAAQTTEDGRLIMLNTERGKRKKGAKGATDGILRIAQ